MISSKGLEDLSVNLSEGILRNDSVCVSEHLRGVKKAG